MQRGKVVLLNNLGHTENMGSGGSIPLVFQPRHQNADRPNHAYANPETRRQLKDKPLADVIDTRDLLGASEVNPAIKDAVIAVIGARNTGTLEDGEADTTDAVGLEDGVHAVNKRLLAIEYLTGALQRLRNQNIYNFFIVTLSLLALSCNLPQVFWSLLCSMSLLFSKDWTLKLAKELGNEVSARDYESASDQVGFVVADNKCYMMRQTFMHAECDDNGVPQPRLNGQMLYTNNVLWSPVTVEHEIEVEKG